MRIVGAIFIVLGFLVCLTIIGISFGLGMMFIGGLVVVFGGRRKTVITNVVQVTNAPAPEQRYVPPPEIAIDVPEVRQVQRRDPPMLPPTIDITPRQEFAHSPLNTLNASDDDYDRKKWQALLKYDPDLARVAEKMRQLGDHWVDELARSYLAINDKAYLPNIVNQIIADARKEHQR